VRDRVVGHVAAVGHLHPRGRSASGRMSAWSRRPDAWRAAHRSPSPPSTKSTARVGDSGLPVLARLVAAAGDLLKLSPRTCVGTLVLVTAPPANVVAVVVVVALPGGVVAPTAGVGVGPCVGVVRGPPGGT